MLHPDVQYRNILREIIYRGIWQENRTKFKARFIPSATIVYDLKDGFPALTTKKLYFKQSIGEILGFFRGYENAKQFRELGCEFWNSDANENKQWLNSPFRKGEDDLGKVYGSTWRNREAFVSIKTPEELVYYTSNGYLFIGSEGGRVILSKRHDQLSDCLDGIINRPRDRRNIMHAWFPELFPQMALPPCHVMYEFVADEQNKVLHMTMSQRSCDSLLGVPMNLFGSALILAIVAKATGYTAGQFSHHMTNVHLYENQIKSALIQIDRHHYKLPTLEIASSPEQTDTESALSWIESLTPNEINIINYKCHPALPKIEMAQEC